MSQKKVRKIKGHELRKKVLRVVIGLLLAILFLEFTVYFGSNLFLANWARNKVNEATSSVYSIDFNRLNISLVRRGIFLDGIVMKPNDGVIPTDGQTLFDFSLDQLAFKGLWYSFEENIFYLGKLELDNPNVQLTLAEKASGSQNQDQEAVEQDSASYKQKESPVASLEREIRKTIEKTKLNALVIREIEMNNADLFFLNFLSDNSLKVEKSKLLVRDMNLTTTEDWITPFNARGFEFEMESGQFTLPDGVHTVEANRIFISSLEEIIDLKFFRMTPDRTKPSKSYYELSLDELLLNKVDLNRAFVTSELQIDEIVLNAPDFHIGHAVRSNQENQGASDLNDLINGILKSLSINELSINRGQFVSSDFQDTLKNRIELGNLDFKMVEFYLGEDDAKKENQFFYGDEASMIIGDVDIYLSDGIHLIEGDRVTVNSFTDQILVQGFKIEPRESFSVENQPKLLLRIELPELELSQARLKKFYNEGKLDISQVNINSPKVEIIENESLTSNPKQPGGINELLEGYLSQLKIGVFDLKDGEISFTNASGIRSDGVGFDRFSLLLEDVLIEPEKVQNTKEFFLANELVLNLDNYRLKLRDNLHEFSAEKVIVDSKNERVELQNFKISPNDTSQVQTLLSTYGKTAILDLDIPYFAAEGVDLRKAFFEEELVIRFITIPSTSASFDTYAKRQKSRSSGLASDNELSELLTQYFRSITIDSLSFEDGNLSYQNFARDQPMRISEDGLSIDLKNFHVERGMVQRPEQTFFSDEISINFKDYAFSLAGGNYSVLTNNINYNSKAERISIENLSLIPSASLSSKLILAISLPEVVLEGVNMDRFLFENSLELKKLKVVGSEVNLEINPDIKAASRLARDSSRNTSLPKSIDRIAIDSIEADQSFLKLDYLIGETDLESIETKFDILIQGFDLDSATLGEENISGLYDQISISLQDFSFALPDSVHTLKFSDVELNTATDESVFSNFQIIPSNIRGKAGKPVVLADIASVGVKNNKLFEILSTRRFELSQLTLTDPDVKIYLDQEKEEESSANQPEEIQEPKEAKGLVNSLILDDVIISNGEIQIFDKEEQPIPKLDFDGINLSLVDLNLELLGKKQDTSPDFFLNQDLSISLTNYSLHSKDSLTKLTVGKMSFKDRMVHLEDLWFRPTVGRYKYLRTLGFQSDAIEARVRDVKMNDIDLEALASERKIVAQSLVVDGLEMDVFRDKRLPLKEGVIKPMPQKLLQSAPIQVSLDSFLVINSHIRYQELVPRGNLVGALNFNDLNVSIVPFVTTPDTIPYPLKSATLKATALIEGDGDVSLEAKMDFKDPYEMDVDIELGAFDLTKVNSMMERTVFVGVNSGKVTDGRWRFKINKDEAWGRMRFYYEDLKVQFLDSLTLDPGTGKLGLYTFAANTAIKNQNPRGLFKKKVTRRIYYERDKSKFIFGGWMRATLSGLRASVGLGRAKDPKRREDEDIPEEN
ncbi:hypothetical protein ACFOSV_01935 [Algoriphagus namhaensis]|uniref:Translocation/assembly module TamB n=1 Tax=Algoriphagus namhaensis TaxID=915353 RepID=A0ABV8ALW1_9BACT